MSEQFTREAEVYIYGDDADDGALEELFKNIDEEEFQNKIIKIRCTPFIDYVKRYEYEKLKPDAAFDDIPDKEFKKMTRILFRQNGISEKMTESFVKQFEGRRNIVSRDVVFGWGFGLGMNLDEISLFLKKAARQYDFDFKVPKEVVFYYCFSEGVPYQEAVALLKECEELRNDILAGREAEGYTCEYREQFEGVKTKQDLMDFVRELYMLDRNPERLPRTRTKVFSELLHEFRGQIIASTLKNLNMDEEIERRFKLIGKEPDCPIEELTEKDRKILVTNEELELQLYEMYEEDYDSYDECGLVSVNMRELIEQSRDKMMDGEADGDDQSYRGSTIRIELKVVDAIADYNWAVGIATGWSEWIKNARLKNISNIEIGRTEVNRNDIITLAFLSAVYENRPDWEGKTKGLSSEEMFDYGVSKINDALESVNMMPFYLANPFESFIAICLYSRNPEMTFKVVNQLVKMHDEKLK